MSKPYQKVIDYYNVFDSKIGYDLVLGGVKHFGYYPSKDGKISEKKAQELMQDLVAKKLNLTKNNKVLDAGCGQGYVACYLAKKYDSDITGITVTPFEVEKAKKLAKKMKIENKVRFLEMDYADTTFPDNYFDAIYTMETLVHAYNLNKTFRELKRILKPKGRIVFFEYSLADNKKIKKIDKAKNINFEKITDWVVEKSAMFSLKKFRHGFLPKVIREKGFTNIKSENITQYTKPSFIKLYNLSKLPYHIVKIFGLTRYFLNTTISGEWFKLLLEYEKEDLIRYNVITATKP